MARPRFVCLILALITLLIYLPVWHYGFLVYDDPEYVTENRIVQDGLSAQGAAWAFTTFHASNWHPLTWLSHMFDSSLFGPNAGAQHMVNVLFHMANAILLFWLLFQSTRALWPAAVVAALFAWHPLRVESVAWISERKDVLSAFFGLLCLNAYARYVKESEGKGRKVPRLNSAGYWFAVLFFALGLLAKPMLVTLPFVMLLLDYWPFRRGPFATRTDERSTPSPSTQRFARLTPLLLEKVPFFLMSLGSCVVTFQAQRGEAVVSFQKLPLDTRLGNAPVALIGYLEKLFWPKDLAVLYPLPTELPSARVLFAILALGAITAGVWLLRRRARYALTGWLWFLGMLVPVIGLVQVGGQAMADRYTYLPAVGVLLILAFAGKDFIARSKRAEVACGIATGLALGLCATGTMRQLRHWKDSETLFRRAIAVTGPNYIAQINLGVALEQAGQTDAALEHYTEALRINPNSAQAHNDVANLLANTGKRDAALDHYREAVRLKPKAPFVHENFGTLLVELGQFTEAAGHYTTATQLAPGSSRPHYLMGKAQLRQGQSANAVAQFREALRLDPNDVQALAYLARVLAADEDSGVRNGAEAIVHAQRAVQLTDGDQPFFLDVLAMAYAEAGRFDEARQTIQHAIELAEAAGVKEAVAAMQARSASYQMGKPYRENFTTPPKPM